MKINYLGNFNDYKLYKVDVIESTNTYLKENYLKYEHKSVLIADIQTKGRGRLNHNWVSNNDLIFSIIFKQKQNYLIIALAIIKALRKLNINALIKWPNDIFYNDMKLSGILIEDVYLDGFNSSIVGVGLNLTDKEEFKVSNLGNLYHTDKIDLLKLILEEFDEIANLESQMILKLYKEYSLLLGKTINYNNIDYKVIDFDTNGYMVLENNDKIIKVFYGEVGFSNKSFKLIER